MNNQISSLQWSVKAKVIACQTKDTHGYAQLIFPVWMLLLWLSIYVTIVAPKHTFISPSIRELNQTKPTSVSNLHYI